MNPDENAKGFVNLLVKPDHLCIPQYTGKRATLKVDQPWSDRKYLTQLVFIGSQGGVGDAWPKEQLGRRS